ncbi:unnamed protein product [Effrenium voratum]|uniref:methionine synthase n=1 Tax=Effrenium voratum TaxID=2562239 RepID=A0AA36ICB5_9DINO|nr:unnamed protein product [Effrenium voratum]
MPECPKCRASTLQVADARRAKAAIYAAGEVYRQATVKQRVPPMVINVIVDPATSRTLAALCGWVSGHQGTLGGQTPDAFYVSVKHARPLAVGLISGGTGSLAKAYGALEKCETFVGLKADGAKDWKEPPNLLGLADGLPPQLAQLAAECGKAASVRARPAGQKRLWVSGHESHKVDGFTVVAQRGTRASGKFKELLDDFKAGGGANALTKALKLCASEVAKGADVLDISADGIAGDGSNRGSKSAMSKFCALYDEDARVAKAPVMLCSADWKVLKAGLGHLQGRCIVNALCLMLGEDEFLRIAKECLKHGAALVVMAVGEQGRAVTSKDKVELLQRSYKLLRQKLDFPAEDIILDVHLQSLRHDEHPSEVIAAIKETRRTSIRVGFGRCLCPHASIACGLSNLSAAFGQLRQLREALHSVFLRHSVPLGARGRRCGRARKGTASHTHTVVCQVCEDVILNSKKDESALRRFMAFLSVRSGAAVCLPLQAWAANEAPLADAWWELPECKAAAKEAQAPYVNSRQIGGAASQKNFFQGLKPAYVSPIAQVPAEAGCERPAPWRVSSASGAGALQQQVSSALSSGTKIPERTLPRGRSWALRGLGPAVGLAQLNLMLSKQVLIMDGPAGPAELLSSVKDEASFTGGRPDLVLNAHRALLKAGADLIRTNTRNGDVLCQDYYGTGAAVYELNKAAATLAKQAVQEAVSAEPQSLKFAAGVIGPSTGRLTAVKATTTWDQMVQAYRPQVKGLVDGGVHLLLLDMVSDTLNAKAAIYAVQEYFGCYPKERVPVIINVSVTKEGRTGSGQSLAACVASLMHAQPLAFGVGGDGAQEAVAQLTCPCWVQLTGAPKDAQANLVSPTGSKARRAARGFRDSLEGEEQDVSACAKLRGSLATRPLPAAATAALRLSGLEVTSLAPEEGLKLIGQRCHVQGSQRFKGLVHACKYTSPLDGDEEVWEAALDVAKQQVEDKADLLDLNFDSPKIDAKKAMGSFVRRCGVNPSTASVPLVISSGTWDVIAEGLKSAQGKCIVNGLSLSSTEEEFLRGAEECRRFGAAVVILALSKSQFEFPNYQEKVGSCQRAFQLLRSKLDFPPEDIIFDCLLTPVGSEVRASPKDFTDAVAELKRTCPGSSFVAGVSNLSHGCRTVQMLRDALASSFLQQAVPKGLNLAFVELGHLPHPGSIEEPTKSICAEERGGSHESGGMGRWLSAGCKMRRGIVLADPRKALKRRNQRPPAQDKTLVPIANVKAVEPLRPSPQFTNPVEILVQATGTINSSIFQTFGSKAHAAANYHRLSAATQINRTVHFSSISVYMGQGGSGPVTGASGLMDGLSLWERHQGVNHYATTVLWGAIGEIGLRKAIYGSRDVFAQFDLGQKLIGPADTAFLERQVCCNADTWDFVGLAYLDNTWKDSLAGTGGGGSGLSGRKTFLDN